ncbi:undecaprenyldiphospho-muramoylpentapeptide beta-N-acetylglucosaminyltransferase [Paenibacillus sp.]|uniref:undecaprenyldiphospho-muramoylpentapeptide beta-N-acetylglucosaminyltransferase n=1 Tax=Paenibacillus sp. TaxID=58172 RepID=UPI002D416C7F|nr:undecaprenyldiphospho-muramoylpentapeptide beta-N-acetylglucosaminyltransferase [Paenibacillus sp.]HZG86802.1 undecaprenyldiphospho-muramoylpentapeptide beta-N-acetylglucosaminyltransferase [Paenibacillus sp.]
MKRSIVFTGGGTAGHVTVNLALMPHYVREGWDVHYIGSAKGIERELVANVPQVTYHAIATGKLRRYMDWNNVKDPFRVMKGVWQAYRLLAAIRPSVVFSKGGFVSVPVVAGAWLNRIPAIIHESDLTPGLANRLAIPLAAKVCTTFPDTAKHLPAAKAVHVGAVVREELFRGEETRGLSRLDFVRSKPVLLVMGGSLGSQRINRAVRDELEALTDMFQIVHLCGKGNVEPALDSRSYRQFEYVTDELPDLLAAADVVVSRAGSNSIFEFLALKKPMLLIPLSLAASRGDQIANAESFRSRGFARVLPEEELTGETFVTAVRELYERREQYVAAMEREPEREPLRQLIGLIDDAARGRS